MYDAYYRDDDNTRIGLVAFPYLIRDLESSTTNDGMAYD